jgi:integrase
MTTDLFDTFEDSLLLRYRSAFEAWASESPSARALGRDASVATYRVMWTSLTKWALAQNPPVSPEDLCRTDLELFLAKRGKGDTQAEDLSPRYVWRLLNLVDRVLQHDAACRGGCSNPAAKELMQTREEWQHANAAKRDPLPDYLTAAQAKDLVNFLSAARPRAGRRGTDHTWQELRNRAMVAVHLGAGATPLAVRSLKTTSVIDHGGPRSGLPWKLVYASSGDGAGHEGPIAGWAGHILRHWMESRQSLAIPGEYLFPSTRTGKPIGKVAQYLAVCQTMEASGLDKSLVAGGSFRLRHTFALRQLRRGHAEAEVARWMGVEAAEMARYRRVVFAPVNDVV